MQKRVWMVPITKHGIATKSFKCSACGHQFSPMAAKPDASAEAFNLHIRQRHSDCVAGEERSYEDFDRTAARFFAEPVEE